MSKTKKDIGLIVAIVFASSVISGSAVFFGMQMNGGSAPTLASASGQIGSVSDEQLEAAIESFIENKQKEEQEAQAVAIADQEKAASEKAGNVPAVSNDDHVYGDKNAKITLIEYSDFQCPYCKKFHETPKAVVDKYDGKVNWVYRHFPLSFHNPPATLQAMASECAAEIGGNDMFWDFSDVIFEKNPRDNDSLVAAAVDLGLDESQFKTCLESEKYKSDVETDMQDGVDSGVTGTPGTIVYNSETGEATLVSGARPASSFEEVIDRMLQ